MVGRSERFTKEKTPIWIYSTVSLVTDQAGDPSGYISVGRDITEQVRAERAEQEQRNFTEALQRNILTIRDSLEMEELLSRILDNLEAIIPHDTASIMLLEGDTAHLVKGRGYEEQGFEADLNEIYFPIADIQPLSEMRETQLPIIVKDVTTDPRWSEYQEAEAINWIRSYIGVPIILEEELLGFLNVDSTQPNYFSETHAAHAQIFANQIAIAIRNARLHDETVRRTRYLETLRRLSQRAMPEREIKSFMQTVMDGLAQEFGYGLVGIALGDDDKRELTLLAASGTELEDSGLPEGSRQSYDTGILGWVISNNRPYFTGNTNLDPHYVSLPSGEEMKSQIAVPLRKDGQAIGVLTVEDKKLHAISQVDLTAMVELSEELALHIDNLRLYEQTREQSILLEQRVAERTQELSAANDILSAQSRTLSELVNELTKRSDILATLHEVSLNVGAHLDNDELLDTIVKMAVRLLDADMGGNIYLYDVESNTLKLESGIGPDKDYVGDILNPGQGLAGHIFETQTPLIVEDYREWEGRTSIDADYPFTCIMGVPLLLHDACIGVLSVNSDKSQRVFFEDDRWLAELFGSYAAVAINNAQLYSQLERELTERLHKERELQESQARFSGIVELAPNAIVSVDSERRIILFNQAAERIFGYAEEEVLGEHVNLLIPDQFTEKYITLVKDSSEGGISAPQQLGSFGRLTNGKRKDGSEFPAEADVSMQIISDGVIGTIVLQDITERVEREKWLQFQARLLESVSEAVIATDLDGTILYWGDGAERLYGYSAEETLVRPVNQFFDMKSAGDPKKREVAAATAAGWSGEHKQTDQQGNELWLHSTMSPIKDEDDQHFGFVTIDRNITEAKKLIEAEREQRVLAEALNDIAVAVTSTLEFDEVLERVLHNLVRVIPADAANIMLIEGDVASVAGSKGYQELGVADLSIGFTLVVSDYDTLTTMISTRQPLLINDKHNDPQWKQSQGSHWIQSYLGVAIVIHNQPIGFLQLFDRETNRFSENDTKRIGVFTAQVATAIHNARLFEAENRERLRAQTLQRTAEALTDSMMLPSNLTLILEELRTLVDYDCSGVLLVDESTMRFSSVLGEGNQRLIGREFDLRTLPKMREFLLANSANKQTTIAELGDLQSVLDPEATFANWYAIPLVASGTVLGLLGLSYTEERTLTEEEQSIITAFSEQAALAIRNSLFIHEIERNLNRLKNAQEQLVRSTRLSTAGQVAAGVAHQINNPLTAIIGRTHLLQMDLEHGTAAYRSVENIQQAAYRAGNIVQRMLDLARDYDFDFQPMDINASIERALSLIRVKFELENVQLEFEPDESLPPMMGSDQHLQDVWLNLLFNAYEAIISHDGERKITIRSHLNAPKNSVEISVTDTGPGIPEEIRDELFMPFVTTKEGGTGLGLSICREIVSYHEGDLQLVDSLGGETTLIVSLPRDFSPPPDNQ